MAQAAPLESAQQMDAASVEEFPIDLDQYHGVSIDAWQARDRMSDAQRSHVQANVELCRDAIVLMTSIGAACGVSGHSGGAYGMMPEVCLLDSFFRASPEKFVQIFFDEAGHRVATQYLFSVLRGHLAAGRLFQYRRAHSHLPGHPELGNTPGIEFSSGRLGHLWAMANGVAMGNPGKIVPVFSSDGSQMEGNTAEAARFAAAKNLNIKLFIDDNDVTIAGHPSDYLSKYDVGATLRGHGITVAEVGGEDLDAVFQAMQTAVTTEGPYAVVLKRPMCPGVKGLEGATTGHSALSKASALQYLEQRGLQKACERLQAEKKVPEDPYPKYLGSGKSTATRLTFGEEVVEVLKKIPTEAERKQRVCVVDSDLEGSCGFKKIREECPEVFVNSGVMERGNFSACAGFGFGAGPEERQGVFGTFAAFQEMLISEITMARLNRCNVMLHFSHSGVDGISDDTCHFGVNNFFADCGFADEEGPQAQLFFPADAAQMRKVVSAAFWQRGLRFVYSTRVPVPEILDEAGNSMFGGSYVPTMGKDELVRDGSDGFIISYGDALYRSLDAVERLKEQGLSVGLVNKWHMNVVDDDMLRAIADKKPKFILVVESQNIKTGLGVRFGTWLLERGISGFKYARCGTHRSGCGGQWEQAFWQGYDPESIMSEVKKLM